MSQILVIGNDPKLRERLGHVPRRRPGTGVRMEFLELTDVARLARKRPQAIVLDVRSPSAATIEVISRLRRRLHQPPLMLQVTPRQMQERVSWMQALPTSRIEFFTSQTSKKEIQGLLERLLERVPLRASSGLSEMLVQLATLTQSEDYGEDFHAPTPQAADRMRDLLEGASEFGPDAFPPGTLCADGDGGLRLEWIRPCRELRLVIAASEQGKSYLYHESGDDYGADYGADYTPDAEKLGRSLKWLASGGKAA